MSSLKDLKIGDRIEFLQDYKNLKCGEKGKIRDIQERYFVVSFNNIIKGYLWIDTSRGQIFLSESDLEKIEKITQAEQQLEQPIEQKESLVA